MMAIIMTTQVGVRDLKLHAPRLVERAARGERITITRYGRARALLVPAGEENPEGKPVSGRAAAWNAERRAFERLEPELARKHRGRYVAVAGGRVVGSDVDPEALYERVWKKLGDRVFFLGRVGAPAPVVEMPGFEVE